MKQTQNRENGPSQFCFMNLELGKENRVMKQMITSFTGFFLEYLVSGIRKLWHEGQIQPIYLVRPQQANNFFFFTILHKAEKNQKKNMLQEIPMSVYIVSLNTAVYIMSIAAFALQW